jgi:hypothetical protein
MRSDGEHPRWTVASRQGRWPTLILVHTPVHGSWLNQVEIYHSIIQRKVLDPNASTTPPPSAARSTTSNATTTGSRSRSPGTSPARSSPRYEPPRSARRNLADLTRRLITIELAAGTT